jgi:lysophospholipase L1-like esterase
MRRLVWLSCCVLFVGSCGGHSGGPGPSPPIQPPQIACPSEVVVKQVPGSSQAVDYPPPTVTGGAPPVTTNCTRASGSSFPLGTTSVTCAASDAQSRQASCSFNVTLSGFTIAATKYDAFGDSLTEGEVGRPSIVQRFIDTPNAYPTQLQASFDQTYPGQGIVVINRGVGGDKVEKTVNAIRQFVPGDKPDGVLVLSGFNNLTDPCKPGLAGSTACRSGIDDVANGILDCIRKTRESSGDSVKFIFVSTLTPPGPTGSQRIDNNAIVQANNRIKQVAASNHAVLVDAYAAFVGHEADYVNVDGLHLRPAGYQALSDVFFAAIKATVPQTPLLTANPLTANR